MSLVFRAIWADSVRDPIAVGLGAFREWVLAKHGLEVPEEGAVSRRGSAADVLVQRVSAGDLTALRATLHEERRIQRWTSTLTVIDEGQLDAWFWVDIELVAEDAFRLPDVDSPRLVRDLLDHGNEPHRGPIALGTNYHLWHEAAVPELVAMVLDPLRDVPLVVFTPDSDGGLDLADRRASSAALLLAGVASVGLLSPSSVRDFNDHVGPGVGVWGGACRVYLPGVGPGDLPYRHFLVTSAAMRRDERQAGRLIFRRLATSIGARRAPEAYEAIRIELSGVGNRRSIEVLEADYVAALESQDILRLELAAETSLRIDAAADVETTNEELSSLQRQVDMYRRVVEKAGVVDTIWSEATAEVPAIPEAAESCTDAGVQAQLYLENVILPDSALTSVLELDAQVESRAWGQTAWRGFRALDAYVSEADRYAGFWEWCKHSGSAYAWPATSKKLAITESEGVVNSRELREARIFEVSPDVAPDGRVLMLAHLKIAEGGGPMAPRVYFFDDTKGTTRKVHVGFFGPHKYVPNQGAN